MLKQELRLHYQNLRNSLSSEELSSLSLQLANRLLELPIWSFDTYHLFLQLAEKKEVDTSYILSILLGKDKNVVLPKMEKGGILRHYLLTDNTVLKKNKWHIPEPTGGLEVPAYQLDVVFMPLLAFDQLGNRVGYGKGFYDHFLEACHPKVLKIGLSLFEAEDEPIADIHKNDIPMDYCVTPSKTYRF
ncbi:5-formyltetrahydrofolate cyclo-ligase [Spongiimicrobium sp. 2-473A-2-J]|uniref:5-formyltetrahydrofolate cyclo-ligase n=1 Tax=Eudoraea algarum TaxID=3417568 RepID=UPI003D36A270